MTTVQVGMQLRRFCKNGGASQLPIAVQRKVFDGEFCRFLDFYSCLLHLIRYLCRLGLGGGSLVSVVYWLLHYFICIYPRLKV